MKVTFTATDRLFMNQVLPQKGEMGELISAHEIRRKVGLSKEQLKTLNMRQELVGVDHEVLWDEDAVAPEDFELTTAEVELLKNQVSEFQKTKTVTRYTLDLCRKIRDLKDSQSETP